MSSFKEYATRIYDNGDKQWFLNDKLHRENGLAAEYSDGYKAWYLNGKPHREDGPAVEYADSGKEWWLYGKRHRADGPAVEHTDGYKAWYLDGEVLTEEEWKAQVSKPTYSHEGKVVEIDGKRYRLAEVNAHFKLGASRLR